MVRNRLEIHTQNFIQKITASRRKTNNKNKRQETKDKRQDTKDKIRKTKDKRRRKKIKKTENKSKTLKTKDNRLPFDSPAGRLLPKSNLMITFSFLMPPASSLSIAQKRDKLNLTRNIGWEATISQGISEGKRRHHTEYRQASDGISEGIRQ